MLCSVTNKQPSSPIDYRGKMLGFSVIYVFLLGCKLKTEVGKKDSGGGGVDEGGAEGVVEGKVRWHRSFCMPGITLCFKVCFPS